MAPFPRLCTPGQDHGQHAVQASCSEAALSTGLLGTALGESAKPPTPPCGSVMPSRPCGGQTGDHLPKSRWQPGGKPGHRTPVSSSAGCQLTVQALKAPAGLSPPVSYQSPQPRPDVS